ncbi:MAG: hypothetical protein IKE45_10485 [Halomonas sp.]|nr:hypothetical protein [Halomonas sp.]MBR2514426.1 hypothetical protein [Halomonas sp.]
MTNPNYTPDQFQELNELEAKYGFPGLMVAGVDPKNAITLSPFQRQHAADWLCVANQRFGEELKCQLSRSPTAEELANRLSLSMAMSACDVGDNTNNPISNDL